ncbi:MAG: nucleotidyltransferase domain-containing protein [Gammaproteobacteria bacterium]
MRSLTSSVLKWPTHSEVDAAARRWALSEAARHPEVQRIGYFGSYARGDWGVGSDLDLIAIVDTASEAFPDRPLSWSLTPLLIPAQILIYTRAEWQRLQGQGSRFARDLKHDTVWIYVRRAPAPRL